MSGAWLPLHLPRRVQQPLDAALTLWQSGELAHPRRLLGRVRTRAALDRLQRSFFYHRYATALLLAHEAGVFDALAQSPLAPHELAHRCNVDLRAMRTLLRVLESERLVIHHAGRYALARFAAMYLCRSGAASIAGTLDLMSAQAAAFPEILEGLSSGRVPAGLDIFSPGGRYVAFLEAVNAYLAWASIELLRKVDLPVVEHFIVGSMGVSFSARLLEQRPGAQVTYGCLPHLVREIPRLCDRYGVPGSAIRGMHEHGGDPESDRWGDESFDLVFLTKKMILSPEEQIGERFVRKAFDVLRPSGVLVLWETVHSDSGPTPLGRAMEAVLDLAASPVGPVNTESSLRVLLEGIGYRGVEIVPCLGGQTTFVVARRRP